MIQIVPGNILTVDSGILIQQVNCKGVMGAGLAKQLREKYPGMYSSYLEYIRKETNGDLSQSKVLLGKAYPYHTKSGLTIINCFGQDGYGHDTQQTDYAALRAALTIVANTAVCYGSRVAIPWGIGCALAGGDWNLVMDMILEVFQRCDVTIYKLPAK